jgi:hypothetical protein
VKPALRRTLLGVALGVAAYLVFFADHPVGDSGIAEPTGPSGDKAVGGSTTRSAANEAVEILELRPRVATQIKGNSLFGSTAWVPPPKPPPPPVVPPPPPPRAPQLPFSYIGKRFDGTRWEVFVSRGAETLILRENDLIDGTYRVESIRPPQVSIVYVPLNEKQSLAIGPAE